MNKPVTYFERHSNQILKTLERDIDVAICQSNLAAVYVNLDRIREAMELWKSAYKIFSKSLGVDHPNTKTVKEWIDFYSDK